MAFWYAVYCVYCCTDNKNLECLILNIQRRDRGWTGQRLLKMELWSRRKGGEQTSATGGECRREGDNPQWKSCIPLLLSQILHCLPVFHYGIARLSSISSSIFLFLKFIMHFSLYLELDPPICWALTIWGKTFKVEYDDLSVYLWLWDLSLLGLASSICYKPKIIATNCSTSIFFFNIAIKLSCICSDIHSPDHPK